MSLQVFGGGGSFPFVLEAGTDKPIQYEDLPQKDYSGITSTALKVTDSVRVWAHGFITVEVEAMTTSSMLLYGEIAVNGTLDQGINVGSNSAWNSNTKTVLVAPGDIVQIRLKGQNTTAQSGSVRNVRFKFAGKGKFME